MSDESYLTIRVPADILKLEPGALRSQVARGVRASTAPAEEGVFRITVEVPAALTTEDLGNAFEVVADAAHEWADTFPERTWDICVFGGMGDHTLEAAFAARGEAMRKVTKLARGRAILTPSERDHRTYTAILTALEDL